MMVTVDPGAAVIGGPPWQGRYELLELLGAGAMGTVYRARDTRLGREVALKLVKLRGLGDLADVLLVQRFENESRALAAVSHPNIVPLHDAGVHDGVPFMVMELAGGRTLADRVERGRLAPEEAIAAGRQLASALAAAHAAGILHRDVKPSNLLDSASGWKLADFGIAHIPESSLTMTGQFLGTPAYAAPEALFGTGVSDRTDVYGLAAALYEALIGTPPYGKAGLLSPGALGATAGPLSIASQRPDVPAPLAAILERCLARDPALRPSAAELVAELDRVSARGPGHHHPPAPAAATPSPPRPRRGRALAIAAALAGAGIAIGVAASSSGGGPPRAYAPAASIPPADRPYDRKRDQRMRKAIEKAEDGELRKAQDELHKILDEHPDDLEARALLDQLERQAPSDDD